MAPSYKDQIKDLKYYLSSQDVVISELKKDRESAVTSLVALYRGVSLVMAKMGQWDELRASEMLDMSDIPDLTDVNLRNYPLLADLGLQILSVTIRVLSQADRELAGVSEELKVRVPEVPTSWFPSNPEIPSPLTRALSMLENALDETPKWKSKRASEASTAAISEAETLIHAMESSLATSSYLNVSNGNEEVDIVEKRSDLKDPTRAQLKHEAPKTGVPAAQVQVLKQNTPTLVTPKPTPQKDRKKSDVPLKTGPSKKVTPKSK